MPSKEEIERRRARAQAVDEEYEKLIKVFYIDSRRIVLGDSDDERSGGYGIVRPAELHHSASLPAWLDTRQYGPPQLVAVKALKTSWSDNMTDLKREFTKEALVWSKLGSHPGILKFLGFHADFRRGEAWLLSPWQPNGNISEFIEARHLEVPEKLSLVYDTIDALAFLHQSAPPVSHGCIKSANVLVTANYRAVLCDFGTARLHEDSGFGKLETETGFDASMRWCSPEIIDGGPRAPPCDVYSWAWLVWEIMTGERPYGVTYADYVIIHKIFERESRLRDCRKLWELMTRCWNVDPQRRPAAGMCKTIMTYLPRRPLTPGTPDHQTRSAERLENLGDLESWKGNHEESFAYLDEAMCLYRAAEDTRGIAGVLLKKAAAAYRLSDYNEVIRTASTALEYFKNLDDALGIADASYWLGSSLSMRDTNAALPFLSESLKICRTRGNDVGTARCLDRIGEIQRCQLRTQEALSTLEEAVEVATKSGDHLEVARALLTLGTTHYDLSDFVRATKVLVEAGALARDIGWEHGLVDSLWKLGQVKTRSGDYREAEELLRESISIARDKRARWGLAWALWEFGICLEAQSKLDEAAPVLEEACLLYQALSLHKESRLVASTLSNLRGREAELSK